MDTDRTAWADSGWWLSPSYARNWPSYRITGTTVLKVTAYIR
jgi:hypothetical protein